MEDISKTWKDEYWAIVLGLPFLATLIYPPWGTAIFATLATVPVWYQYTLGSVIFATYGIKAWRPISTTVKQMATKSKSSTE